MQAWENCGPYMMTQITSCLTKVIEIGNAQEDS